MKLDGKRVLIIGRGPGIRLELARRLARAGRVMIAGRHEARLARACAAMQTLRADPLDMFLDRGTSRAAW